jgi:hypothetical protein
MQPFELVVVQLEEYRWRAVLTAYPNAVGYGSTRGAACEALLLCIGDVKYQAAAGTLKVGAEYSVHMGQS